MVDAKVFASACNQICRSWKCPAYVDGLPTMSDQSCRPLDGLYILTTPWLQSSVHFIFCFFFLSLFFREMWGLFLSMLVWPSLSQLLSHVERKPVPNGEKEAPPGRGSKIHHRELREWTDCYTLLSPAGIIAMLFFNDIYCILYTRSLNGTTVASIFSNNFLWPLSAHVHQSLPLHFVTRLLSASLVYSRIHFRFFRFQLRPWWFCGIFRRLSFVSPRQTRLILFLCIFFLKTKKEKNVLIFSPRAAAPSFTPCWCQFGRDFIYIIAPVVSVTRSLRFSLKNFLESLLRRMCWMSRFYFFLPPRVRV